MAQQSSSRPSILAQLPDQPEPGTSGSVLARLPDQPDQPDAVEDRPTTVSAITRFSRVAVPLVGSIIGGTLGAAPGIATGNPPLAYFGAVAGAGAGAAGAELLQTGAEQLFPPEGADTEARAGLVERVARELNMGASGEAGGRLVTPMLRGATRVMRAVPGVRRLLAPFESKLEPFAHEALEQFTVRGPGGNVTHVLPGEVTRSRVLDAAQNISESSFFGGAEITRVRQARQVLGTQQVQAILDNLGPVIDTGPLGQQVFAARRALATRFRRESRTRWNTWRRLGGKVLSPTPATDAAVAELLGVPIGQIKSNTGARAAQRWANMGGDDALTTAAEEVMATTRGFSPEQLTSMAADSPAMRRTLAEVAEARAAATTANIPQANALQELISQLGEIQGIAQQTLNGPSPTTAARRTLRIATIMRTAALDDIQSALRSASPDAQDAYETARTFTRAGEELLNPDPVTKLMGAIRLAPEQIVDKLVKPNNASQIMAVRESLRDAPGMFRLIQTRALRELTAADPVTDQINWATFLRRFGDGEGSLGANTINALFPDGHAQGIQHIARLMQQLGVKQGGGIGSMAIQLSQGGAIIGLVSGVLRRGAATLFIVPAVLARIMASRTGLQWLTTGLQAPVGSPIAARAAGNLLSFMLTPEADATGETPGVAPGTTLRVDPARLGEITGQPGVRTGAQVSVGP